MQSYFTATILLSVLFFLLLDFYVFQGMRALLTGVTYRLPLYLAYWLASAAVIVCLVIFLHNFAQRAPTNPRYVYVLFGVVLLFLLPKLIFSLFLLAEDLLRLVKASVVVLSQSGDGNAPPFTVEDRRRVVSQVGLAVASVPFVATLYGILRGKEDYRVHRVTLTSADLPPSFDGFTITQISDIHSGTFNSHEWVQRGVDLTQAQQSDLIVFTGDLVNFSAGEIEPWIDVFKTLNAPHGVYSTLGNHDYGEYVDWASSAEEAQNLERLKTHHQRMGYRLLLNESVKIVRDDEHIALIGVENWGLPPFPQKGDLDRAAIGTEASPFRVLLSHDPSHWDAKVRAFPLPIHLTLSGHTHGMQFGVEVPGWKWSPVQYRYPRWADLYEEGGKYLYVNRGFGCLGYAGRVGIWPEVTVITLRRPEA